LDAADRLALWPDDVADAVGTNLDGDDAGCVLGHRAAVRGERLLHFAENVQPRGAGLGQRLAHDVQVQPVDLDIHLDGRHTVLRARHLEIHVTHRVFRPQDVRQDGHALPFLHQAHRYAGAGTLDRDTRIHQGQRTT